MLSEDRLPYDQVAGIKGQPLQGVRSPSEFCVFCFFLFKLTREWETAGATDSTCLHHATRTHQFQHRSTSRRARRPLWRNVERSCWHGSEGSRGIHQYFSRLCWNAKRRRSKQRCRGEMEMKGTGVGQEGMRDTRRESKDRAQTGSVSISLLFVLLGTKSSWLRIQS